MNKQNFKFIYLYLYILNGNKIINNKIVFKYFIIEKEYICICIFVVGFFLRKEKKEAKV